MLAAHATGGVGIDRVSALNISFESSRLIGGPEWIEKERFDIVAAIPEGARPADLPRMLRTLLEQRFHLLVHTEMRELPIYTLRLARTDGKLGPRLTPSTLDCAASIFTALQEQLGLRLESARAPLEVFVIDRVERQTDN